MQKIITYIYKLLIIITVFFSFSSSFGQIVTYDTNYWFAIPSTAHAYRTNSQFRIATYNATATVTLSIPANPSFTPKTVTIPANSTGAITFTATELGLGPNIGGYPSILNDNPNASPLVNNIGNSVGNTGILVTSTARIAIYYESGATTNSPDFTSLKGRQAMGTSFLIPMQETFNVRNLPAEPNRHSVGKHGFLVTATDNNTLVTIVPKTNITGHLAGTPFNITLNRGQTYFAQNPIVGAPTGSSGSTVVSDKPVVVTIYADQMQSSGSFDLGMEQIVPTSSLGREYFVTRGDLSINERVYITAVNNNTSLSINGVPIATTLAATQTHTATIPTNTSGLLIQASDNISVLHVSGRGNELAYSILPALDGCRGITSSTVIRSQAGESQNFFITVLSQNPNGFTVNGSTTTLVASDFTPTGMTGWWYARKDITNNIPNTAGAIVGIINTNGGKFHLGAIHGQTSGSGSRYGYFTEYSTLNVTVSVGADQVVCYGENVHLSSEVTVSAALGDNLTYHWSGPNGFSSTSPDPTIYDLDNSKSGVYTLTVESGGCSSSSSLTLTARPCKIVTNPMIFTKTKK